MQIPAKYKCHSLGEVMVYPTTTPCCSTNFEMGFMVRHMTANRGTATCPCCAALLSKQPRINEVLRAEIKQFMKTGQAAVDNPEPAEPKKVEPEIADKGAIKITREALEVATQQVIFGAMSAMMQSQVGSPEFKGAAPAMQQRLDRTFEGLSKSFARMGGKPL